MDYATSLSEAQQQLLAQYEQHLQQQQQQQQQQPQQQQPQQQQPQQQASQVYDPTQLQSYDPSSQAYYPYHQAYQTPVTHHQHPQQYPYYTPDYGASAAAASSNVYQADAISQAQDPSAPGQQYYPQDQQAAYNASLNPAAAAAVHALSQLTQFAGTMDAAERAVAEQQWSNGASGQVPPPQAQVHHAGMVHPHAGGGPYRGGGRRGGGPFRGGKGNFGHRHQRQDGGSFRGRGRGRGGGGGRRFPHSAPEVQALYPVHAAEVPPPYAEPGTVYEPSQAAMPGPGTALSNAASRRTTTVIFCELCRVECNSGEIFEKHKIGKRHKKNLQRLEELEHQKKQTAESDMRQRRTAVEAELQQNTEQPEYIHFDGENATSSQEAGVADAANEIAVEGGQQSQMVEQSQTPKGDMFSASAKKRKRDNNIKKTPLKRKTSFVQDGKRMRVEPSRPEAPKELPVHCALCNVTCDTMAVFQCHLSGKKHASRIKRSQIQTIAYVPPTGVALYIPYGAGYGQRPPPAGSEPVSQEGSAPISLDHQAGVTEPVSQQLTATITEDLQAAAAAEPVIQQVSAMTTEEHQDTVEERIDQDMPMVGSEGQNTDFEPELKDVNANNTFIPTAECGDQTVDNAIPSGLGIEAEEPSSGVELQ